MTPTIEQLKTVILKTLAKHLEEGGTAIVSDLGPHFEAIAQEAGLYALKAAAGEEDAVHMLDHLRVQAALLGSMVYQRGYKEGMETLKTVIVTIAQTLGVMLKAAIL